MALMSGLMSKGRVTHVTIVQTRYAFALKIAIYAKITNVQSATDTDLMRVVIDVYKTQHK